MTQSNFNFYKADKAYGELYLQFPKVFLYSDKYSDLSNDAKIAYMVFKDRLQYSIKNNWIDEDNNVYFIYTNKELETLLNCSKNTVTKIKKELEDKGLLLQIKQGFDPKTKRNRPNRLYLADLEVEAYEVYSYQEVEQTLETSGIPKNGTPHQSSETLDTSGIPKNGARQKVEQTLETSGIPKNDLNQYKELNKDNKDNKDQSAKTQNQIISNAFRNSGNQNETDLIEQYIEDNVLVDAYGQDTVDLMQAYSFGSFETFKVYADKFYYAWQSAEKDSEQDIMSYHDVALHDQLARTFKNVIMQYKAGKTKNINNYLFIALKNVYLDRVNQGVFLEQETDSQPVPLYNWLDTEDN